MQSITKRKLNNSQLHEIVIKAFGPKASISDFHELKDGWFNNSYKICLSNGEKYVLKIAPPIDVDVLTYEKDIMNVEVETLNKYKEFGIIAPEVIFYDNDRNVIDNDYFFMTYIDGVPLNKISEEISDDSKINIYTKLGQIMSKSFEIKEDYFGSPAVKEKRHEKWFDCFYEMISDLFDDAKKVRLRLPISKKHALKYIENKKIAFEEVNEPILIHKDIWAGNIFVDKNSHEIMAIIDCERAIYGDPLLEVACGSLEDNEDFMNNYYKKVELTPKENTRLYLYKFYLLLLMVVECPYREYKDKKHFEWCFDTLKVLIDKMKMMER